MTPMKRNDAPVAASVRANQRLLAASGALGGAIGVGLVLVLIPQGEGAPDMADLLHAPLPAWFAILVALAWGVALPLIAWRWQRVVDEHEREAYRDGAVAGFYVMGAGAPVWWVLARGGLVAEVDPIGLYVATLAVTGIVWMYRKYA